MQLDFIARESAGLTGPIRIRAHVGVAPMRRPVCIRWIDALWIVLLSYSNLKFLSKWTWLIAAAVVVVGRKMQSGDQVEHDCVPVWHCGLLTSQTTASISKLFTQPSMLEFC
ncbi:hypothetical protein SCHPADRAFT_266797 [Schizopora paradoxa]|uniref:Uncharacterized protein n=1 Tax=Schizopora paradoxa TaxID=27342 RepID=A0A0H2S0Z9_9AGAM|nr:hypothetical protein SCHPADRAFT_266797 [Schizopora paradoxa]